MPMALSFGLYFNLCYLGVLQTQQHKFVSWQSDMEYRGEDFTTAVTLGNPDVLVGSGMCLFMILEWIIWSVTTGHFKVICCE